mmetsp:Transcript_5910/g.13122  ORF Transcript_5910/g.13122 Transcript_5910/m.13122 type:complete len:108 (-) Transcript_5910:622-945(-)
MLHADTPVVAVTTIFLGLSFLPPNPNELALSNVLSTCDFPDPAGPLKKVEWPESMDSTTVHCSVQRVDRSSGGRWTVIGGGEEIDLMNASLRNENVLLLLLLMILFC